MGRGDSVRTIQLVMGIWKDKLVRNELLVECLFGKFCLCQLLAEVLCLLLSHGNSLTQTTNLLSEIVFVLPEKVNRLIS